MAETEEEILQDWNRLRRIFFGKSPEEIANADWLALAGRMELDTGLEGLEGVDGWVDVPTSGAGAAASPTAPRALLPQNHPLVVFGGFVQVPAPTPAPRIGGLRRAVAGAPHVRTQCVIGPVFAVLSRGCP